MGLFVNFEINIGFLKEFQEMCEDCDDRVVSLVFLFLMVVFKDILFGLVNFIFFCDLIMEVFVLM